MELSGPIEDGKIEVEKVHFKRVAHEYRVKMMEGELDRMGFKLGQSTKRLFQIKEYLVKS